MKEVILTPEGYEKLKQEIEVLSTEKRREVADRIRVAREFGDISENAEYDDAKNEQAMLEHKIAQLEERLLNARVIQKRDVDLSVVSVGAKVKLRDVDAKRTDEYFIVGSAEANPAELKLSNESPVGKAIIGKKKGETVEVATPRGSLEVQDPRHRGRLARTGRRRLRAAEPPAGDAAPLRALGSPGLCSRTIPSGRVSSSADARRTRTLAQRGLRGARDARVVRGESDAAEALPRPGRDRRSP